MAKNGWDRLPDVIREFAEDSLLTNEQIIRGTMIKLAGFIAEDTPVDEGITRGNWYITSGAPSKQFDESNAKPNKGAAEFTAEMDAIGDALAKPLYLTNNAPNIIPLEYGGYKDAQGNPANGPRTQGGYSIDAPSGMVRKNVKRFKRIIAEEKP